MKFLIIQENGRHLISLHLRECFSLQRALLFHEELCDVWGLGHDNFNQTPDFESYDVIINLENYDQTGWVPDLSGVSKPIKLMWAIDSHCQGIGLYEKIFIQGKYTKILEATKHFLSPNRIWFPNCYDSDFINPLKIPKSNFIGFCGNYVNRHAFFNQIKARFPEFKLDINVRGIDMIRAINSYQIHFNKNMLNDINYRNFETLGCGTCLLTSYDPYYNEMGFKEGENCFFYQSLEEAIEKIKYLKNNPETISKVAEQGHIFGLKNHTFKVRAKTLIEIVKSL
jgi:hypothetical protein